MKSFEPGGSNFLGELKRRVAQVAVNSSSARNMGKSGLIPAARSFLDGHLHFRMFRDLRPAGYEACLDDLTDRMRASLRSYFRRGTGWGSSRKYLNIFIRDAFYDYYLREAYGMEHLESVLEIPLDSYVGMRLREQNKALPKWKTVIGLTPEASFQFQAAAAQVAERLKTYRVHLDVIYWRKPNA